MNVKRYALGVVTSATCLVTGVLWWDRVNPDVRAEDVAACIAAGVERHWVTDWVEPTTNTVTAYAKASDLERAATLMRNAVMDADVIYLDPGTWSDGGLDMAYGLAFYNSCYEIITNTYTHIRTVQLKTPQSVFINGVALADKYMPYYAVTSITSIVTNQAYAVHTNLVIVSQTNTASSWSDYGRTNGTVFVWNNDLTYGNCYTESGMNEYNTPVFLDWDEVFRTYTGSDPWSIPSGSPVGTYTSESFAPGSVEIGWHDSFVVTPLDITTNLNIVQHGGTNMPLYAALGTPPDSAAWGGLIGSTNSWWAYAGFGSDPYWLLDVEKPGGTLTAPVGTGRYTIETRNLTQLRALATNMVRTVDFDFAVTGTNWTFSGNTTPSNNYSSSSLTEDQDDAYIALPGLVPRNETTNAVSSCLGIMATETTHITRNDHPAFPDRLTSGSMLFSNKRYAVKSAIPEEAFTNGFVSRFRVYIAAETKSLASYDSYTNTYHSYNGGTNEEWFTWYQRDIGENNSQDYGSGFVFGSQCADALPFQQECPSAITVHVGYLTTNFTWSLVLDVDNPTTNPVIVIGPDDLISGSYFVETPPLVNEERDDYLGDVFFTNKEYERDCETKITHTALVIDWNFKVFGATPYVPIETNRPAWMP